MPLRSLDPRYEDAAPSSPANSAAFRED
jgi:hypothetical protein